MSDCFDQFDRAVHRMHFPFVDLHRTRLSTLWTSAIGRLVGGHFASAIRLHHPAEPLANLVRWALDLIVMRRSRPLLLSLNLAGKVSRLLKNFFEFYFEFRLFRVHATLPES